MSGTIPPCNPRLRRRSLARVAVLGLASALVLWLSVSYVATRGQRARLLAGPRDLQAQSALGIAAMGQFPEDPENGSLVLSPRPEATWLIDDTHLWRPMRPEHEAVERFRIVTAGPHVILLDSHLGNTWLLRPGEAGKDDRPEWILIFREILDDERRPPAPPCPLGPATDDDLPEEDTEDDDFDPFVP